MLFFSMLGCTNFLSLSRMFIICNSYGHKKKRGREWIQPVVQLEHGRLGQDYIVFIFYSKLENNQTEPSSVQFFQSK